MRLGLRVRIAYSREFGCLDAGFPLVLDGTVDRCGNWVIRDKVTICQSDSLLHTTSDGLPATPCSIDTVGRIRGNGDGTGIRVAILAGVDRPGESEMRGIIRFDMMLYTPWRVKAPSNVATSKWLLF